MHQLSYEANKILVDPMSQATTARNIRYFYCHIPAEILLILFGEIDAAGKSSMNDARLPKRATDPG